MAPSGRRWIGMYDGRVDPRCRWLSLLCTLVLAPLTIPAAVLGMALTASLIFAIVGVPMLLVLVGYTVGTIRLADGPSMGHRRIVIAAVLHAVAVGGGWWLTALVAFEPLDVGDSADAVDQTVRALRPVWAWCVRIAVVLVAALVASIGIHAVHRGPARAAVVAGVMLLATTVLILSRDALWQPQFSCAVAVRDGIPTVELDSRWDLLLDQSSQEGRHHQLRAPFDVLMAEAEGRIDVQVGVILKGADGTELSSRMLRSVAHRVEVDGDVHDHHPSPGQVFAVAGVPADQVDRVASCQVATADLTVPSPGQGAHPIAHLLS